MHVFIQQEFLFVPGYSIQPNFLSYPPILVMSIVYVRTSGKDLCQKFWQSQLQRSSL
jgi:hypothetical protein